MRCLFSLLALLPMTVVLAAAQVPMVIVAEEAFSTD